MIDIVLSYTWRKKKDFEFPRTDCLKIRLPVTICLAEELKKKKTVCCEFPAFRACMSLFLTYVRSTSFSVVIFNSFLA